LTLPGFEHRPFILGVNALPIKSQCKKGRVNKTKFSIQMANNKENSTIKSIILKFQNKDMKKI